MAQLTVGIDDDLKDHLQNLARQEGKTTSDVVRGLVRRYVQDRDRGAALRSLWDRMQHKAEEAGASPGDVDQAIRAVREESRPGASPAEDQQSLLTRTCLYRQSSANFLDRSFSFGSTAVSRFVSPRRS